MKRNLLREIISKYSNDNEQLSEKELLALIRSQSMKNGMDISLGEIQELISDYYSNNRIHKK